MSEQPQTHPTKPTGASNSPIPLADIPISDRHRRADGFVHPFAVWVQLGKIFIVDQFVAVGGYGSVFRVHCEGEYFAIKAQREGYSEREKVYRREASYLQTVGGRPGVVGYYGAFKFQGHLCLRMELASMSLQQRLTNRLSIEEARNITREIAVGLKSVHAKNVVHRDIKTDNILISDTTGQALICDFGLSGYLPTPSSQLEGRCGTKIYWAREMRDKLPYGTKVDCYAMGTIARRLLENFRWDPSMPLEEIDDKKAEIMDLVNHLLEEEPEPRYSAEQALQHPFFLKQEHQQEQQEQQDVRKAQEMVQKGQVAQEVEEEEADEIECSQIREGGRNAMVAWFEQQWTDTRGGSSPAGLAAAREADTISIHRRAASA